MKKRRLSQSKAKTILHEGIAHGKPITDKQRRFFGAVASGSPVKTKSKGGATEKENVFIPEDVYWSFYGLDRKFVDTNITIKKAKDGSFDITNDEGDSINIEKQDEGTKERTIWDWLNGLNKTEIGIFGKGGSTTTGDKNPHGYYIYVTPKNTNFKPHIWIEGGWFQSKGLPESIAEQLRKNKQDYDKKIPFYSKVEVRSATEKQKKELMGKEGVMAKGGEVGEDYIVVLPYDETSRLFHVSKTKKEEAYLGDNDIIVYYESKAKRMPKGEAEKKVEGHLNKEAFIKKIGSMATGGGVKKGWTDWFNSNEVSFRLLAKNTKIDEETAKPQDANTLLRRSNKIDKILEQYGIFTSSDIGEADAPNGKKIYYKSYSFNKNKDVAWKEVESKLIPILKQNPNLMGEDYENLPEFSPTIRYSGYEKGGSMAIGGRVKENGYTKYQMATKMGIMNKENVTKEEVDSVAKKHGYEYDSKFERWFDKSSIGSMAIGGELKEQANEAQHQLRYAKASVETAKDYIENTSNKEKAIKEIGESEDRIQQAIDVLEPNNDFMKMGGEIEEERKNLQKDIDILKESIESETTDESLKNDMKVRLKDSQKRLSEITEKIQRNVTIPPDSFWVAIDNKYANKMRTHLGGNNIKFTSRTVKGKYTVYVDSQELLDRVVSIYNMKRAKGKDKPVSASDVSGKSEKGGKLWVGDAVKNERVLRNKARRMGLIKNDQENLSETDLKKIEQEVPKLKERVNLARTKKKFSK